MWFCWLLPHSIICGPKAYNNGCRYKIIKWNIFLKWSKISLWPPDDDDEVWWWRYVPEFNENWALVEHRLLLNVSSVWWWQIRFPYFWKTNITSVLVHFLQFNFSSFISRTVYQTRTRVSFHVMKNERDRFSSLTFSIKKRSMDSLHTCRTMLQRTCCTGGSQCSHKNKRIIKIATHENVRIVDVILTLCNSTLRININNNKFKSFASFFISTKLTH